MTLAEFTARIEAAQVSAIGAALVSGRWVVSATVGTDTMHGGRVVTSEADSLAGALLGLLDVAPATEDKQ